MVGHPIIPSGGTTYESWRLSSCTADKLLNIVSVIDTVSSIAVATIRVLFNPDGVVVSLDGRRDH